MRVLPGVVGGTPRARAQRLLAAGAMAAAVALAGCSQFDAALGQRQAIVSFKPGTALAQRLAVRAACARAPDVTPQPLPSNMSTPYALNQVVYQINHASDADVALLEKCLTKFPSVIGVALQDAADEGS